MSRTHSPMAHADIRIIVIGVGVAMFLGALDQTIVATALPTIGRDLGDFDALPWVVTPTAHRHGGDAALRQAQRHPRPPRRR